jgi:hypothetical protein
MVTDVLLRALVATFVITGPAAAVVVKVLFAEVLDTLLLFADTTSKSYVVPGVRLVNVTEWLVTRLLFGVEDAP